MPLWDCLWLPLDSTRFWVLDGIMTDKNRDISAIYRLYCTGTVKMTGDRWNEVVGLLWACSYQIIWNNLYGDLSLTINFKQGPSYCQVNWTLIAMFVHHVWWDSSFYFVIRLLDREEACGWFMVTLRIRMQFLTDATIRWCHGARLSIACSERLDRQLLHCRTHRTPFRARIGGPRQRCWDTIFHLRDGKYDAGRCVGTTVGVLKAWSRWLFFFLRVYKRPPEGNDAVLWHM